MADDDKLEESPEELLEDDEVSPEEEGFLKGYEESYEENEDEENVDEEI